MEPEVQIQHRNTSTEIATFVKQHQSQCETQQGKPYCFLSPDSYTQGPQITVAIDRVFSAYPQLKEAISNIKPPFVAMKQDSSITASNSGFRFDRSSNDWNSFIALPSNFGGLEIFVQDSLVSNEFLDVLQSQSYDELKVLVTAEYQALSAALDYVTSSPNDEGGLIQKAKYFYPKYARTMKRRLPEKSNNKAYEMLNNRKNLLGITETINWSKIHLEMKKQ